MPATVQVAQFILYGNKISISMHMTYHDSTTRASTQLDYRADFLERGCALYNTCGRAEYTKQVASMKIRVSP